MTDGSERFVLRLEKDAPGRLRLTLDGPGGPLAGGGIDWTGAESWYRFTTDRKAIHERAASEAEAGRDALAPLGRLLYDDVLGEELAAPIQDAIRRGAGVQLQVECPREEPRLLCVPWQLLHDGEDYLFRRGVAVGQRFVVPEANLLRLDGPFRVLVVFASPTDAEVPPAAAELHVIEHVYRSLPLRSRLVKLCYGVRREDIEAAWREARGFHAVHVLCPATHDTLLLEGPRGRSEPLYWTTLAHTVRSYPVPWMVTLGTGRWPRDPWRLDYQPARDGVPERSGIYELGQPLDWSAFATACGEAGVPLVLAWQLPIDARAGRAVSERFYRGVLSGNVDAGTAWRAALQAARRSAGGASDDLAPPALLGRTDLRLPPLPTGPAEVVGRGGRAGVDIGLFPVKPTGRRFAGRYHVTAASLRHIVDGRGLSFLVTGAPGMGKTSFVENLLELAGPAVHAVRRSTLRPESTVESICGGLAEFCEANGWPPPVLPRPDFGPDAPQARAAAYADAVTGALHDRRAILLVEDAERALTAGDGPRRFADPALGPFLGRLLATLRGSGLVLVSADLPDLGAPVPPDVPVVTLREPQPRTARELFERWPDLAALGLEATRGMYLATRGLPGVVAQLALLARHRRLHTLLADLVPRKLHADSEAAYREHMVAAVADAAIDVLSPAARELLFLVGLCEKPERQTLATQLGIPAGDGVVAELRDLDLISVLRPRDVHDRHPERGPVFLWTNPIVARVARERAAGAGRDLGTLRERMGACHALAALEQGRAAASAELSEEDRVALRRRRRMGLLRAFSYFARAGRWQRAAEVTVQAAQGVLSQPLRAELRRMGETLVARPELSATDAANVLTVLAQLDAADGLDERVLPFLKAAADAARSARRPAAEADVRLRIARVLEDRGESDEARAEAQRAEALALQDGDAALGARAVELVARVDHAAARPAAAADEWQRAAALFERVGEIDHAARALRARTGALLAADDPAAAARSLARAWVLCRADGSSFVLLVERLAQVLGEDALAREWLAAAGEPLPGELLVVR
jgi:hypothetical protein